MPGRLAVVPVPVGSVGVQVSAARAVQVAAYLRDIVARAESDRGALTIEQHNEALARLEAVTQGANVQPEAGAPLQVALRVAIPGQSSDFVRYQTVHGLAETVAALAEVAATVAGVGRAEAWADSGVCLARVTVSPEASGWHVCVAP